MPKNVDWVKLVKDQSQIAAVNGAAVGIGVTMICPLILLLRRKRQSSECFYPDGFSS